MTSTTMATRSTGSTCAATFHGIASRSLTFAPHAVPARRRLRRRRMRRTIRCPPNPSRLRAPATPPKAAPPKPTPRHLGLATPASAGATARTGVGSTGAPTTGSVPATVACWPRWRAPARSPPPPSFCANSGLLRAQKRRLHANWGLGWSARVAKRISLALAFLSACLVAVSASGKLVPPSGAAVPVSCGWQNGYGGYSALQRPGACWRPLQRFQPLQPAGRGGDALDLRFRELDVPSPRRRTGRVDRRRRPGARRRRSDLLAAAERPAVHASLHQALGPLRCRRNAGAGTGRGATGGRVRDPRQ